MGLAELNQAQAGLVPSGVLQGEPTSCFFQLLEVPAFLGWWPLLPSTKPAAQNLLISL